MSRERETAVSLGWRRPHSMALVLWPNALMFALLGAGFTWAAVYPLLGGTRSDPIVLGVAFEGMATTFKPAQFAAFLTGGALCLGFAGVLVWLARRNGSSRVVVDSGGVTLRSRDRSRHAWTEIKRFEVATLLEEGLVAIEQVDGHCAVMV